MVVMTFEEFDLAEHDVGTKCPWCGAEYKVWRCERHDHDHGRQCGLEIWHEKECKFLLWLAGELNEES